MLNLTEFHPRSKEFLFKESTSTTSSEFTTSASNSTELQLRRVNYEVISTFPTTSAAKPNLSDPSAEPLLDLNG